MGHVIDLQAAREARGAKAHDFTWADQVVAWRYSTPGRLIAAALTFAVILTGLGVLVFGLWAFVTP